MAEEISKSITDKVKEANQYYRKKQYFQSLEIYNTCIRSLQGPNYQAVLEDLRLNLYSLRGMNYTAIRDFPKAESDFNLVLISKIYDSTTLMRRAVLYIKMKELEKALEDIIRLYEIEPESLRVAALMLEIKDKISQVEQNPRKNQLKQKYSSLEQGDCRKTSPNPNTTDSEDSADQEELLNFSGLRNIQRMSKIINVKTESKSTRCSIVSFREDSVIDYQQEEAVVSAQRPVRMSRQIAKEIFQSQEKQVKELQAIEDDLRQENNIKVICRQSAVTKMPKKSILKASPIVSNIGASTSSSRQFHDLDITQIKDAEGKVIHNRQSGRVTFRKSQFDANMLAALQENIMAAQNVPPKKAAPARKSCLKKSSITVPVMPVVPVTQRRKSKASFIGLKIDKAEGKLVRHVANENPVDTNEEEPTSTKSFDSSDQHNIFGKSPIELSQEMKQALGINEQDPIKEPKSISKEIRQPKKSILKKASIVMGSGPQSSVEIKPPLVQQSQNVVETPKKAKKSVLFR